MAQQKEIKDVYECGYQNGHAQEWNSHIDSMPEHDVMELAILKFRDLRDLVKAYTERFISY